MKEYCPACAIEVEYERIGYDASCTVCGRTKSAAKQTVRFLAQQRRDAKLKRVWIALGVIAAISLFGFYILSGGSERMLATLDFDHGTSPSVGGVHLALRQGQKLAATPLR